MADDATKLDEERAKRHRTIYLKMRLQELKQEIADIKTELNEMRTPEAAE